MTIGRTDERELCRDTPWRSNVTNLFGISFAEPIWASGPVTAQKGRTHDRTRSEPRPRQKSPCFQRANGMDPALAAEWNLGRQLR